MLNEERRKPQNRTYLLWLIGMFKMVYNQKCKVESTDKQINRVKTEWYGPKSSKTLKQVHSLRPDLSKLI